jgi:hypothetical protein
VSPNEIGYTFSSIAIGQNCASQLSLHEHMVLPSTPPVSPQYNPSVPEQPYRASTSAYSPSSSTRNRNMSLRCDWPSCKGIRFENREQVADHQNAHYAQLMDAAKSEVSFHCGWHDCTARKSGKVFLTSDAFKKHLRGHIKNQWCEHPNCELAFARKSDRDRHFRTKHLEDRDFCCPVSSCDRSIAGFTRKDKLDEHTRKDHDNVQCILDHCGARLLEVKMDEHLNLFHGGGPQNPNNEDVYECVFRGCEATSSRFTKSLAERHLRKDHYFWDASAYVIQTAREAGRVASKGNAFVMGANPAFASSSTYRSRCKTCTVA